MIFWKDSFCFVKNHNTTFYRIPNSLLSKVRLSNYKMRLLSSSGRNSIKNNICFIFHRKNTLSVFDIGMYNDRFGKGIVLGIIIGLQGLRK